MATDTTNPKSRVKVALPPGRHLMDWVRLNGSMTAPKKLRNISPEELALHNKATDCWTAYDGKVYNITNYLPFHPGGEKKLMLGAGKDCTALFNRHHRWVNGHSMLSNCLVGLYVSVEDNIQPIIAEEKQEQSQRQALTKEELTALALSKLEVSDQEEG